MEFRRCSEGSAARPSRRSRRRTARRVSTSSSTTSTSPRSPWLRYARSLRPTSLRAVRRFVIDNVEASDTGCARTGCGPTPASRSTSLSRLPGPSGSPSHGRKPGQRRGRAAGRGGHRGPAPARSYRQAVDQCAAASPCATGLADKMAAADQPDPARGGHESSPFPTSTGSRRWRSHRPGAATTGRPAQLPPLQASPTSGGSTARPGMRPPCRTVPAQPDQVRRNAQWPGAPSISVTRPGQPIARMRVHQPRRQRRGTERPCARGAGSTPTASARLTGQAGRPSRARCTTVEIRPVEHNTVLACDIEDCDRPADRAVHTAIPNIAGLRPGVKVRLRGQVGIRDNAEAGDDQPRRTSCWRPARPLRRSSRRQNSRTTRSRRGRNRQGRPANMSADQRPATVTSTDTFTGAAGPTITGSYRRALRPSYLLRSVSGIAIAEVVGAILTAFRALVQLADAAHMVAGRGRARPVPAGGPGSPAWPGDGPAHVRLPPGPRSPGRDIGEPSLLACSAMASQVIFTEAIRRLGLSPPAGQLRAC